MQSKLKSVSEYMKTVPEERKSAMTTLRKLCVSELKGFEESMEYGMPGYKNGAVVEVAINSQKNYIALYILKKDVLDRYRKELNGISIGKGCIRYSSAKKINFDIVKKLLADTAAATSTICPR